MSSSPLLDRDGFVERLRGPNPVLVEGSAEHRAVRGAGWEVAFDGMEVTL